MKSFAVKGIMALVLLYSVNATAKITSIEKYKFNYNGQAEGEFVCESISGLHSSIPAGYNCTQVKVQGKTCYKNCNCPYTYTSSNCANGTLSGSHCDKNGTTYYQTCTICENTWTSDNCSTNYLSGSTCTKNDGKTYYQNCTCNFPYTTSNCVGGTLSGNSCMKNGTTYYQTCTMPTCEYQYTSSNCSPSSYLAGGTCTRDGVTYHQYCNCPYTYTASSCSNGTLGGGECTKDGTTYRETCTPCEYQYTSSNCTSSLLAGGSCVRNGTTYRENCNCNYEFTSANCNGTLSGGECMKNGTTYRETCTPRDTQSCTYTHTTTNCSAPTGSSCVKNGVTYYQNCNCNYYNTSDNCSQLTGSSCKKNNKNYYSGCNCGWSDGIHEYFTYTYDGEVYSNCEGQAGGSHCTFNDNGIVFDLYTTCTPCDSATYPYTTGNCAHPTGNTCTTPDFLDDDYDYRGGITYYQSCNSPISINCNVGDWVYRFIGVYEGCCIYTSNSNSSSLQCRSYEGDYSYNYYPGCLNDGYDSYVFNNIEMYNKNLSSVEEGGIITINDGPIYDAEFPVFICVSNSTALTEAELKVWNGALTASYGYQYPNNNDYNDIYATFNPEMAPLTYTVEGQYGETYYGGYKLTGIFLGNGKAVDISGWKSSWGNQATMDTNAYSQWFGILGVSYSTLDDDHGGFNGGSQWGDSYCYGISNQACNSSGTCHSQPDIAQISCATGTDAGLINTWINGSRKFGYKVSNSYGNVSDVEGTVYPANLCLGKNLGSVSGYSVTTSSTYDGMVYYYLPTEDDWLSYPNPISSIAPLVSQFRTAFSNGSTVGNNNVAMPIAYGNYGNDTSYWSSTCTRGAGYEGGTCRGGNTYVKTKVFKPSTYNNGVAISGQFHMTGCQKNGAENYPDYPVMWNMAGANKQGSSTGNADIHTRCFISLSGYNTEDY